MKLEAHNGFAHMDGGGGGAGWCLGLHLQQVGLYFLT